MKNDVSKTMRQLEWDEVVREGDFVIAGEGFESWEGPTGFRADSFLKPIYRARTVPSSPPRKTK